MVEPVCDAFNDDVTCFCFAWFGGRSAEGGWMGAQASGIIGKTYRFLKWRDTSGDVTDKKSSLSSSKVLARNTEI